MRRTRTLAVLTALIVAVTTFLVPATARADVTNANLSVAFDRLSADRTAALTLTAESASGITGVEVTVEQPAEGDTWTSIATLPLTRTGGTANDGTWTGAYTLDIETHPGSTRFVAEIASADGATLTAGHQYVDNCHPLTITGLTSSPGTIDADTPLTVAGRVLAQKTRDAEPEPAPDVSVWNATSPVLTGADGSFSFTHAYASPLSLQANPGWLADDQWCSTGRFAPSPEITRQSVELSADIVTPQPVGVGDEVVVEGSLQRNGADGLAPVAKVWVAAHVTADEKQEVAAALTAADGTFRLTFAAEEAGPVTVQSAQNDIVWSGFASPGEVSFGDGPQISGFDVTPSPVDYEQPIRATGTLTDAGTPIANAAVSLQFSATGETWQDVQSGQTTATGAFDIESTATTQDGFWRVRYESADGTATASSEIRQVKVRYGTLLEDFSAAAGPGATVTLQGTLLGSDGSPLGAELPIHVYFMAEGETTWEFQGTAQSSAADGAFAAEFTSYEDGYWTAAFWGDDDYSRSNAPIGHVDVPGQYTTAFAEFGASPATVASGETITVAGLLTRSAGGGAAEAAPDLPVHVYFLPAGQQEWQEMVATRTGADGRFEETFTAEQDGYWTAWFFGDEGHLSVNSGSAHVDVQ
ncbi:hypothetical protein [Actinomadura sp. WMMB 499]|uniref:hypothetical protein n=1 Tax=Actinomadura sp. WMMB 499 TaxID=1219491 RepID=UPI0012490229|nr:hypothetical protein [Actinomadura sp. WMMB 499]QFG22033.1 hypothetical protein F7P10_13775 [Actinomadura sp. WMMB 499]